MRAASLFALCEGPTPPQRPQPESAPFGAGERETDSNGQYLHSEALGIGVLDTFFGVLNAFYTNLGKRVAALPSQGQRALHSLPKDTGEPCGQIVSSAGD